MSLDGDEKRDLDEQAWSRAERSILEAQKLKNLALIAGSIAHDFNNLIGSILGNVSFAMHELAPGSPGHDASTDIETAARRAAELTRQLLAFSGRGRLAVESLDFNGLVEEMVDSMREATPAATRLELDLRQDLPPIHADGAQVRQVILNLLTNACQSLPERAGVVTLTTGRMDVDGAYLARPPTHFNRRIEAGAYVHLEVRDTGRGMSRDILGRLLDSSFPGAQAVRPAAPGHAAPSVRPAPPELGLGLAATLAIVRGLRGAVGAGSAPGGGTTVTIVLPVGARARMSSGPRISSPG